jgi:hypothetical protein
MRISSRTQDWPACVKFHAADDTLIRGLVFYGLRVSIDNRSYNAGTSLDSKMGTEVVGTLTHADAPPRMTPRPACVYHALQ